MKKEIVLLSSSTSLTHETRQALQNEKSYTLYEYSQTEEVLEHLYGRSTDLVLAADDTDTGGLNKIQRIVELNGWETLIISFKSDEDLPGLVKKALQLQALQKYQVSDGLHAPGMFTLVP